MSQYTITKKSRMCQHPYSGPTCDTAGVPRGKVYDSFAEASSDAEKLSACNPVGFAVMGGLAAGTGESQ